MLGAVKQKGPSRRQHNGNAETVPIKLATWNKGRSCFEKLVRKRDELEMMLHVYNIDILAVTEANFDKTQTEEECKIKGYNMHWEKGREHSRRKNARVVVYVRQGLNVKIETKLMEEDLVPEVWLSVGDSGRKRFMIGAIYREHKPWKQEKIGDKDGKTPAEQTVRWRKWLEGKAGVLKGDKEVVLLGDFNLQIDHKTNYTYKKMSTMLKEEVLDRGWKPMTEGPTRWEYTARGEQESSVDLLLTNRPDNCQDSGIVEQPGHSDHHMIWMTRIMKENKRAKRKIQKRCWKTFTEENLYKVADLVVWKFQGTETGSKTEVDERTLQLEDNIKQCMEIVAPVRIVQEREGRPSWITEELLEARREREKKRQIARKTKHPDDFKVWRLLRNKVNRDLNRARKKHLERGLEDRMRNSASLHKGVAEFLGWRDSGEPTTLMTYNMLKRENTTEEAEGSLLRRQALGGNANWQEGGESRGEVDIAQKEIERQGESQLLEGLLPAPGNRYMWVKQIEMATEPIGVAEAMVKQYMGKNLEVKQAIGKPSGDYLERVRRLTVGNCGKFTIEKVTEKQVRNMIRQVDKKGSFGIDLISYKDIKLLEKYVVKPLTELINLSIETGYYPRRWKTARVKPLWKGKGNDRNVPKSYRPVSLLAACARIMEALVARQVDEYAEMRGILHKNVHGYRKGRGTDTALLEVWESVLEDIDKRNIVAMCLLDVSDGFGSVPHPNLLRKLETYGYDNSSLEWFSSYLEGRDQFVVVEATDSRTFETDRGIPQGGPLCPSLFREYTNDLPEDVKRWGGSMLGERGEERQGGLKYEEPSLVSRIVDSKREIEITDEDKFDTNMRMKGYWNIETWRGERTGIGPDQLRIKTQKDPHDGQAELYADDSTARNSGKTWEETEGRMKSTLRPVFENMKAARLKVNEDKTKLLVIASNQKRRAEGGLRVSMIIGGKEVKTESSAKSLGVIIGSDLSWREQTLAKITDCGGKLAALRNVQTLVTKTRRKELAQSIVISRLEYALEVTSTGRAKDLQDLQYLKVKLARWVLGARRLGWSTTKGFKKLGWMTIQQTVAYRSIRMGMKVLQNSLPESLYDRLTVTVRVKKRGLQIGMEHEEKELRVISTNELTNMCAVRRKSWAVRTLRWFHKVPLPILGQYYQTQGSKTALKKWVLENIPTTGDNILHGKFEKDGRQEGGDSKSGGDKEPPNNQSKKRGKTQGEDYFRREELLMSRQQHFMIDWMKKGENGVGGHTCKLGTRVRTGGRVMLGKRTVEGLIVARTWEEDSCCKGCRVLKLEIQQEEEFQGANEPLKDELIREPKMHIESYPKETKTKLKIQTWTIWLFVMGLSSKWFLMRKEEFVIETKTAKKKEDHHQVETEEQLEEVKMSENWLRSGVG